MKIGIHSSKMFNDYGVFTRAMGVALSPLKYHSDDTSLQIYCAGPWKLSNYVSGFVNLAEDGMKNRGMSIKMVRVPLSVLEEKVGEFSAFYYLQTPTEGRSRVCRKAEEAGTEVFIFRY